MSLSKSNIKRGESCARAMWLARHRPELLSISESQQQRIDQGVRVGELFRTLYPKGKLIYKYGEPIDEAKLLSLQQIEERKAELFEAIFEYKNVQVVSDVLLPNQDGSWRLIEVKSNASVKPDHLLDLAIQKWVLEGNGVNVHSAELAHINNQYEGGDISGLFTIVDITKEVETISDIEEKIQFLGEIDGQQDQPEVPLGKHCKKCEFEDHCFGEDVGRTIYSIPNISGKKVLELEGIGVFRIVDVPADIQLSANQRAVVDVQIARSVSVDKAAIENELNKLNYPMYFLDFETVNPAIPLVKGTRPFVQTPFQFSCHQLDEDGTLSHFEYLHDDTSDPRRPIADALVEQIGTEGSVIAYSSSFEKGVLKKLADEFEDLEEQLTVMAERLFDLLPVVKKHYQHFAIGNSNSIKAVLPVIAPELSYKDIDVQEGTQAGAVWLSMINSREGDEREEMRKSLLEYCELDTFAMVKIYLHLQEL